MAAAERIGEAVEGPAERPVEAFRRDRLAATAYATLGGYAYLLYAIGPSLPFLKAELGLSYTATSLHSAVFSAGTLSAALLSARLTRLLGRRRIWLIGLLGMAAGTLALTLAHQLIGTLASVGIMGAFGGLLQVWVAAVLSDRYGVFRDRALVEANVVASAIAVLAPLALAAADKSGLDWRVGLLPPVVAFVILAAPARRVPLPGPPAATASTGRRLPAAYWAGCGVVGLVVAIEFCVVLWGASFLRSAVDASAATASAAMSAFYLAELAGRIAGGGLTRVPGRGPRLVAGSLGLTAVGFALFWLPRTLPVNVAGLFLTGLGVANLYPLAVALALGAAPEQTDAASARLSLAIGSAILVAPFALGALADHVGVPVAFTLEVALLAGAAAMLRLTVALGRRAPGR